MTKTYTCRDVGVDRDWKVRGADEADVLREIRDDARAVHKMDPIPTDLERKVGPPSERSVDPSFPWRLPNLGAPVRDAARWVDRTKVAQMRYCASAICALSLSMIALLASVGAGPLDVLEVGDGSLGWSGLVIGKSLKEVEKVLGHPVNAVQWPDLPGSATALVVRDGRAVSLGFAEGSEGPVVVAIRILRMAFDPPHAWSKGALVSALRERIPDLVYVPSRHARQLAEAENTTPTYSSPSAEDVVVLVKPQEGFVLIARTNEVD